MNHSCFIVKPRATDYILGSNSPIPFTAITNDWSLHNYFFERQKFAWDTNGCTCFTAQESFDAQMDALWPTFSPDVQQKITALGFMDTGRDGNVHFHSSPRFLQVLTGNGVNGNSMPEVWDVMRKYGVLPFKDLPFDETITLKAYFAPIPQTLMDKVSQFLALIGGKQSIQYHWVIEGSAKNLVRMSQALPQAPLCLGVAVADGWNQYVPTDPPQGSPPEHAVLNDKITGTAAQVLDHYDPFVKILDGSYPIPYALQGIVSVKPAVVPVPQPQPIPTNIDPTPQNVSLLQQLVFLYQQLVILTQKIFKGRNQK